MADPFVFANSQILNDGVTCRARWKHVKGLWNASMRLPARQDDAMARKIQRHPGTLGYAPRKLNWSGRLINQGSFWAGRQQLSLMASRMATRPTRLQIGSLFLEADFNDLVPKEDDKYNLLPNEVSFDMAGEAPGLWKGAYQYALGLAQGITVSDDRIDQPSYLVSVAAAVGAQAVFTFTNPGDAPCEAVFSFSLRDYPSTTIHIQNQSQDAPRAIVYTTDANGNGRLDERHGLILMPGQNLIYLQSSTGALLSVATSGLQGSFNGTVFRWTGNGGNRFNDSPLVFVPFRTGPATWFRSSDATIQTATDGQARVEPPTGDYSSASLGLALEMSATNLLQPNQATCTDTTADTTGFSSAANSPIVNAGATISSDALKFVQGSRCLKTVTTNATSGEGWWMSNSISCVGTAIYTISGYVLGPSGTTLTLGCYETGSTETDSRSVACTGIWQYVELTFTTGATATALTPFLATAAAVAVTFWVDALQLEDNPFATSWANATRNADLCALATPSNLLKYSQDFSQQSAWSQPINPITVASAYLAPDGTYSAQKCTKGAQDNTLFRQDILATTESTLTLSVYVQAGNLSNVQLSIYDVTAGVFIGTKVFALSTSNNPWQRVALSGGVTPGHTISSYIYVDIGADTTAGWIYLWGGQLQVGSLASHYIPTQASPVSPDENGWSAPGGQWNQNGSLAFNALLPPISSGLTYYLTGESTAHHAVLYRAGGAGSASDVLQMIRRTNIDDSHNSGPVGVPNVWDGNTHNFRLWWVNYTTSNGINTMIFGLDVDGTNYYASLNVASSTVIAWSELDHLWLSDGNTQAIISHVILGFPADKIPAGATLAAA